MTEDIELHSFCISATSNENDIEEYHEINQDISQRSGTKERPFDETPLEDTIKTVNEYDFFTQYEAPSQKVSAKKKKSKKKEKQKDPADLMDIINTELASAAIPLATNVINIDESTFEERKAYLQMFQIKKKFQKHKHFEEGWIDKTFLTINPTFPKIVDMANVSHNQCIPVQYVEPEKFTNLITNYVNDNLTAKTKFLDITMNSIKFIHHHNFSLEKLLSVKLIDNYNQYVTTKKILEEITREIVVSRKTKDNLKNEFLRISSFEDKERNIRFDETLRKYTKKLLELKEKHINLLKREKQLINTVISLWSDIVMVREKFNCLKTSFVLEIQKCELSPEDFEKEWIELFHTEYNDMLDKIEYDYVTKYIQYKELKNNQESSSYERKKLSKPKLQFDEEALKEKVKTIVNYMVSIEKTDIYLKEDESIITDGSINFRNSKYYFKVYVNDVFVCESEEFYNENESYHIEFNESFSVQILPNNVTLVIVLCENDDEVSYLQKELKDINRNSEATFIVENFVYNNIVEPNSKCIGSGHSIKEIAAQNKVRLKSSNAFKGNLYTTCEVNMKIAWSDSLNQNESEAIKSSFELGRRLKRLAHGIDKPNLDILIDVISELYGKYISDDEDMINKLKNVCKIDLIDNDEFPIDENDAEFIRLKLLHLRNSGGFADIDNKSIPLLASQISTEQLSCLQKSKENEFNSQYYNDKYAEMDHIELQRFLSVKYVQKLNINLIKNLNERLMRNTHKDVVRDFKDLSLRFAQFLLKYM